METKKLILATLELLVGIVLTGAGLLFLSEVSKCSGGLCSLGLIPVILFLLPGCATLAVGSYCLLSEGRKFRVVQITLATVLFLYYALLMVLWMIMAA